MPSDTHPATNDATSEAPCTPQSATKVGRRVNGGMLAMTAQLVTLPTELLVKILLSLPYRQIARLRTVSGQ